MMKAAFFGTLQTSTRVFADVAEAGGALHAVAFAKASPFPAIEEMYQDL